MRARRPRAYSNVSSMLTVAACLASWRVAPVQAEADDASRAMARQLGEQGIQAYWAKDFVSADEKLDKAYRLFATPTLGLWSARARTRLDHWVEAAERYREAARTSGAVGDSAAQKQAQQDATKELDELLPRIPSLTIQLEGAEASAVSITLDGAAFPSAMVGAPRPTNPGLHQVAAVRGDERYNSQVQLGEKEHKVAPFVFRSLAAPVASAAVVTALPVNAAATEAPAPLTAAAAQPHAEPAPTASARDVLIPISVVTLSLGGVGLIASGVTAIVAANKRSADCPKGVCTSTDSEHAYQSLKTVSTVSFYLGLAFGVTGLVTWLVAPPAAQTSEQRVAWGIGPTGVAVRGAF